MCPAVTFLALGNGAPDISSSIAAISSGNYEMALGALLGGSLATTHPQTPSIFACWLGMLPVHSCLPDPCRLVDVSITGGGLFVGATVAGIIMLVNGGAKARGALLRDVSAYCISVLVITGLLWSGRMTYARAAVLLALYLGFVFIVLGADLWHIFTRSAPLQQILLCEIDLWHSQTGSWCAVVSSGLITWSLLHVTQGHP
jgi:sodium/potassium/calcium exchanger 6